MSVANPLWGAPRIHGELLKLGMDVGQTNVAKYMAKRRRPQSQGWRTFVHNHADAIASIDMFVVPTISFGLVYGLLILRQSRRERGRCTGDRHRWNQDGPIHHGYRLIDYQAAKEALERGAKENASSVRNDSGVVVDLNSKANHLQLEFTVLDEGVFTTPSSATVIRPGLGVGPFGAWPESYLRRKST
jgi:hypothetical protein